ncbi:unnamed protein product [Prunus armeniaca]|uniref:Uncharacterized protein n=1 Tax=Prunus armeniaca TaxID=36596 RepID=A0A6J5XQN2_PRUAR|nr:unnamed protein product [Prunus armeniaca]
MEENEGVQKADAGGECKKNEDEADFSFTCTNPDRSLIFTDDIFQNYQICLVFSIFNPDLLFADAEEGDSSKARCCISKRRDRFDPCRNLEKNKFTGSVPIELIERKNNGFLSLRYFLRRFICKLFKFLYKKSLVFLSLAELMWKSYALDKIRFESIIDKSKLDGQLKLFIPDKTTIP